MLCYILCSPSFKRYLFLYNPVQLDKEGNIVETKEELLRRYMLKKKIDKEKDHARKSSSKRNHKKQKFV